MCGAAKDRPWRTPAVESEDEALRCGRRDDVDEWKRGRGGGVRRDAHSPAYRPCLVESEAGAVFCVAPEFSVEHTIASDDN